MSSHKLTPVLIALLLSTTAAAEVTVFKCVPSPGHPCPSTVIIRRPTPAPYVESTNPAAEAEQNKKIAQLEAARNATKGDGWLLGFGLSALSIDGLDGAGELSVGYHWDIALPLEVNFGFGGLVGQHVDALGLYSLRFGVAPSFGDGTFSLPVQLEYLGAGGSDGPKQLALEGLRLEPRIALGETKSVFVSGFFLGGHGEAALPDRRESDGFAWQAGVGLTYKR